MVKHKQIYFVIDDSGSMGSYSRRVREAINAMTSVDRHTEGLTYTYKYISFSTNANFSQDLDKLAISGCSTNIEAAFRLLNEKVALSPFAEELIIVFISDGCDNNARTINSRLKALGGMQRFLPCTLFTVAVGAGFPTSMVVSALRPNYHNASDCLPLVFPVTSPNDVMATFEQMSKYVFHKDHFNVTMEFSTGATLDELEEGVDAIYNYYTVKCANESDKNKCIALIQEANGLLGRMLELAKEQEQDQKKELDGAMQDEARKPLVSQILNVARSGRKRVQTSILAAITKFNAYLEETVKGNLLSSLSDVEKQKVLSYGNVVGKHLVTSLKYHSADFSATKEHLKKVLAQYDAEQEAADKLVSDYIITQAEAMTDAQQCAKDLLNNAESLVSLVDTLAVVGRLVNIKTCNGTQINPWLIQVESVPTILQHMNTIDFFRLHSGSYNDVNRPGEVANCLIPVTRNSSPKNFLRGQLGMHICTYLLAKNQELCLPGAYLAMQAALVTFCLQQREAFYQDVLEETYASFAAVSAGCETDGRQSFLQYVDHVGSERFREALVTESDHLPKHLKCGHLTKFIFALYLLVRRGATFSTEQLLQRLRACAVEMVGRGGGGGAGAIYEYISSDKQHEPAEILRMVPTELALQALTAHEGAQLFTEAANKLCRTSSACSVANVRGPADIPVSCMGISRASLSAIFARLNAMVGNPASTEFELPDVAERLALTVHGLGHSSYERNVTHVQVAPVSLDNLKAEIERAFGASVCKQAEAFFAPRFRQQFESTHTDVVLLPPDYRSQYKAETGRDVTDDFSVSEETWLPNVACACPDCPNFLRRISKPAFTAEGKPRISDALLRHLQTEPLWMVHGTSRCAKELADEGASAEQTRYSTGLLAAGELLREGGQDMRKRKASQMEAVEHMGGQAQLQALVKHKMAEYQHYQRRVSYAAFKQMMDTAYTKAPLLSAAQESQANAPAGAACGAGSDDFEMIDAPVKSAGS